MLLSLLYFVFLIGRTVWPNSGGFFVFFLSTLIIFKIFFSPTNAIWAGAPGFKGKRILTGFCLKTTQPHTPRTNIPTKTLGRKEEHYESVSQGRNAICFLLNTEVFIALTARGKVLLTLCFANKISLNTNEFFTWYCYTYVCALSFVNWRL